MKYDQMNRRQALIEHDRQYWRCYARVGGIDEAGRGPLAGDVVTACVIMPSEPLVDWVDDSKKLSASRRDKVYEDILHTALYVGVGHASPREIDEINILQATLLAMRRAAENAAADILLIDAIKDIGLDVPQQGIIHGDAISYSIAAASIIAKVTRDREMIAMDQLYPQYGFARHKGYGTREHIQAIRDAGPCEIHRTSFIGKFL